MLHFYTDTETHFIVSNIIHSSFWIFALNPRLIFITLGNSGVLATNKGFVLVSYLVTRGSVIWLCEFGMLKKIDTYIHTHSHTYIHTHKQYTHTYIHTYTHTYIHTHIHTYLHTYTYIHTHTYIHTYINTYT